jgi:hypothetical protein
MFNRRQQHGLTFIGFLFMGIVVVFIALLAMKLIPAYTEYFTIKKILADIGQSPNIKTMSNAEIRAMYGKRAMIDNISTVRPADLEIGREGGMSVASANYTYQTPLVGNISLLVEFSASSNAVGSREP